MKKIKCDVDCNDFAYIQHDNEHVELNVWEDGQENTIYLAPDKIRELRKQLKKALLKIEGVKEKTDDDWFSPGKKVVVTGNTSSHEFPIGEVVIVRENELNDERTTHCEYLDGHDFWFVRPSDCKPHKGDEA